MAFIAQHLIGAEKQTVKEYKFQHPDVNQKMPVPIHDPRARAGAWYLLKTETVGVERCPVHGHAQIGHGQAEGEGSKYRKDKKVAIACL